MATGLIRKVGTWILIAVVVAAVGRPVLHLVADIISKVADFLPSWGK